MIMIDNVSMYITSNCKAAYAKTSCISRKRNPVLTNDGSRKHLGESNLRQNQGKTDINTALVNSLMSV